MVSLRRDATASCSGGVGCPASRARCPTSATRPSAGSISWRRRLASAESPCRRMRSRGSAAPRRCSRPDLAPACRSPTRRWDTVGGTAAPPARWQSEGLACEELAVLQDLRHGAHGGRRPSRTERLAPELGRCVTALGLEGAMVHGHGRGLFFDEEELSPVLAWAESSGVPIHLHPAPPTRQSPAPGWRPSRADGADPGWRSLGVACRDRAPCAAPKVEPRPRRSSDRAGGGPGRGDRSARAREGGRRGAPAS